MPPRAGERAGFFVAIAVLGGPGDAHMSFARVVQLGTTNAGLQRLRSQHDELPPGEARPVLLNTLFEIERRPVPLHL